MSSISRTTKHELAKEVAVNLVESYGGDIEPRDFAKRFCRRPADGPVLVTTTLKRDNLWGDWMGLDVIDMRLDEHRLEPTSWIRRAQVDAWRELGDTGLSYLQAELQIAVSSGPRTDIRFEQWKPTMLTPDGQIIERMVA